MSVNPITETLPPVPSIGEVSAAAPLADELVRLALELARSLEHPTGHPFDVAVLCEGIADTWADLEDELRKWWGYDVACRQWPELAERWAHLRVAERIGSAAPGAKP